MFPVRKLAVITMGAVLYAASAFCQIPANKSSANISGVVRTNTGRPQRGATVEVFAASANALLAVQTVLTDERGKFSLSNLLPGQYLLRVSAPAFLPALKDHITVGQNAHVITNFTLSTIFRAEAMLPARKAAGASDDDWKWTLRASENRALLRLLDPTLAASEQSADDERLSARLALMAGGGFDGLGGMPSVMTNFDIEQGLNSGALALRGTVGYGGRDPDGMLRISYAHKHTGDGFELPEVAFLVRRSSVDSPRLANTIINSYGLSFTETTKLFDMVDVRYGAELENASVVGPQVYFQPFLDAAVNAGNDGRLFYRQQWSGADDPQSAPRLSITDRGLAMERAKHQEAGYERRWRGNHFAASYYSDSISNLALNGMGKLQTAGPDSPDAILAGSDLESFTANAGKMHARGLRVRVQRQVNSRVDASAHFSYGNVLNTNLAPYADIALLRSSLRREMRPAFGGDMKLKLPNKTEVESSYNMTVGPALTPVDALESRSAETAPYLNLQIRQPLPSFLPAHMMAVIDIRNLLAQGYRPVLGSDGRTLFLVQAPRSLRGGLAFTF